MPAARNRRPSIASQRRRRCGKDRMPCGCGHLAESLVGAFFSGIPGLEVSWLPSNSSEDEIDFVLTIGLKRIPVEVKYRRHLRDADSAAVRSFISQPKYNAPFGIVVTRELASEKDNVFSVPMHALLGLR